MPRRAAYTEIYMDEAEGFLLQHALVSPPRTWPPLAPTTQSDRLTSTRKKMDWDGEVRLHPDEPVDLPFRKPDAKSAGSGGEEEDANKERCVICLMALRDRTIVGVCGHEFCFECIGVWANQSRRCPLCSAEMAPFLLHDLDNISPTKFYLPPLPQRQLPSASMPSGSSSTRRDRREKVEPDELDLAVERRREVYQHELFAKHIGSNPTTRFRPNPTPRQIADDPALIQRATAFMRQFLTTYILSLLKAIDVRSEAAIRLLSDYLDDERYDYPRAAEHFAHELYSFLRSPYKDLRRYDEVVQYDPIPQARSRSPSRSVSPEKRSISPSSSRSRSPYRSRSSSRSPFPSSSRSRSRSRSPRSPRRFDQRDTFIPSPSPNERRWDEADTWLDPDYATWLEAEKRRAEERLDGKRRRYSAIEPASPVKAERIELLPSPPASTIPLRMEESNTPPPSTLSIKGAAKDTAEAKRLTLLERLAKAKAEAATAAASAATTTTTTSFKQPQPPSIIPPTLPDTVSISDIPPPTTIKGRGKEVVRARIALKMKLENEKQTFRRNANESKAQELRRRLLESKARREAEETDATLKELDRIDRAKEVRRRLMVLKMMAAETEAEKRARELREKLLARKRETIRV